jgi:hypothetical protein
MTEHTTTYGRAIALHALPHPLKRRTRWLLAMNVRSGMISGDTGREHGPGNLAGAIRFMAWQAARRADVDTLTACREQHSAIAARTDEIPAYHVDNDGHVIHDA